jgi:hypothetical protein
MNAPWSGPQAWDDLTDHQKALEAALDPDVDSVFIDVTVAVPNDPEQFIYKLFSRLESEDGNPEAVAIEWLKKRDEQMASSPSASTGGESK